MHVAKKFKQFCCIVLCTMLASGCSSQSTANSDTYAVHSAKTAAIDTNTQATANTNATHTIGNTFSALGDKRTATLQQLTAQGAQVVAVGEQLKVIIFTDSCFEFGTSTLTPRCQNLLDTSVTVLKLSGDTPIKVAGYSDNNFGDAFALQLTQTQADSIVAYLWAHGIEQTRMVAQGYGSASPIATNYTVRGNGLNRRVEITIG